MWAKCHGLHTKRSQQFSVSRSMRKEEKDVMFAQYTVFESKESQVVPFGMNITSLTKLK